MFLKRIYNKLRYRPIETSKAYDLLSGQYDHQPDNVLLYLDEKIVSDFLPRLHIAGSVIADIGCGTGRHWKKILQAKPSKLLGYDLSKKMLGVLKEKFPQAEVDLVKNHLLPLPAQSVDVIFSTLMIAYIKNLETNFKEWDRILKPGGEILITEYHPEILVKGGDRSFNQNGKIIVTKSYVHEIDEIKRLAEKFGWLICEFTEIKIDDQVRHWYEKQNALPLFNRFKDVPLIYGFLMKKNE